MNAFLEELGKKAAERWLSLLLLPGLLWTTVLLSATRLSHTHPTDLQPVIDTITMWANKPTAFVIALLAGVLLASSAAALAASGLGVLIRRVWVLPGRHRPIRYLTDWRQHRWDRRDETVREHVKAAFAAAARSQHAQPGQRSATTPADKLVVATDPDLAEALAGRDAISLEPPARPTWIGDRWHATVSRIHRSHGLDLTVVWPRLWAVLPDNLRTDISAAQSAYTAASTLFAWVILYTIPVLYWWPAILIPLATAVTSHVRARDTTNTLCLLVETASDLHSHTLAEQLSPFAPHDGHAISDQLRKEVPSGRSRET